MCTLTACFCLCHTPKTLFHATQNLFKCFWCSKPVVPQKLYNSKLKRKNLTNAYLNLAINRVLQKQNVQKKDSRRTHPSFGLTMLTNMLVRNIFSIFFLSFCINQDFKITIQVQPIKIRKHYQLNCFFKCYIWIFFWNYNFKTGKITNNLNPNVDFQVAEMYVGRFPIAKS